MKHDYINFTNIVIFCLLLICLQVYFNKNTDNNNNNNNIIKLIAIAVLLYFIFSDNENFRIPIDCLTYDQNSIKILKEAIVNNKLEETINNDKTLKNIPEICYK
jgi:hypothetical protein